MEFLQIFSSTLVQRFRNRMRMQARDVMGILLLLLVATGTFSLSLCLVLVWSHNSQVFVLSHVLYLATEF